MFPPANRQSQLLHDVFDPRGGHPLSTQDSLSQPI